MHRSLLLPAILLVAVVSACAASSGPTSSPDVTPMPTDSPNPGLDAGDVPVGLVEAAIAEAAQRAGVEPADVSLVVAEAVTWRDGALGCPEPGMMYTQALVPGYRLVLSAGGEELHFHGAGSGPLTYCEDPEPPAEGASDR